MDIGTNCLRKQPMTEAAARATVARLRHRKAYKGVRAYQCQLDKSHWHIGRPRGTGSGR
jgi:hypothetical protein